MTPVGGVHLISAAAFRGREEIFCLATTVGTQHQTLLYDMATPATALSHFSPLLAPASLGSNKFSATAEGSGDVGAADWSNSLGRAGLTTRPWMTEDRATILEEGFRALKTDLCELKALFLPQTGRRRTCIARLFDVLLVLSIFMGARLRNSLDRVAWRKI